MRSFSEINYFFKLQKYIYIYACVYICTHFLTDENSLNFLRIYKIKTNSGFVTEQSFNNSISYLACFSYGFCLSSQKQNVQVVFWIGSSTHRQIYP